MPFEMEWISSNIKLVLTDLLKLSQNYGEVIINFIVNVIIYIVLFCIFRFNNVLIVE